VYIFDKRAQMGSESQPKVGFVFTTKDRPEFTRRCLASVDKCGGFDLFWVDGSTTPEAKALPQTMRPHNFRIAEVYQDFRPRSTGRHAIQVVGCVGSFTAIRFGLRRLLDLGYDYCGIIENDTTFEPDWFPRLMSLFEFGKRDGFAVGAVTARTIATLVMVTRPDYVGMWSIGAGMCLFTRQAAQIILDTLTGEPAKRMAQYYGKTFGVDLSDVWELWCDCKDWQHTADWGFSRHLYQRGLASLGTVPSLAFDMTFGIEETLRITYVGQAARFGQEDEERFARFRVALAAAAASPRSQHLFPSLVDSARAEWFRARLRSKTLTEVSYWFDRAVHPVSSTISLIRKIKKKFGGQ
jgi:hypothetical protein